MCHIYFRGNCNVTLCIQWLDLHGKAVSFPYGNTGTCYEGAIRRTVLVVNILDVFNHFCLFIVARFDLLYVVGAINGLLLMVLIANSI